MELAPTKIIGTITSNICPYCSGLTYEQFQAPAWQCTRCGLTGPITEEGQTVKITSLFELRMYNRATRQKLEGMKITGKIDAAAMTKMATMFMVEALKREEKLK